MHVIQLDSTESTNAYARLLDPSRVEEFTVIYTPCQTAGVGQRQSRWESEPHKNLTFSLILHPTFLRAEEQFALTVVLSLSVARYLQSMLPADYHDLVKIKWPNDIYVAGCKICGMLSETRVARGMIESAICGIGLNVNQMQFSPDIPHPTSIAILAGREYDVLDDVLFPLLRLVRDNYKQLQSAGAPLLMTDYYRLMANYKQTAHYRYKGQELQAKIERVDRYGRLLLADLQGNEIVSEVKEIEFLEFVND